MYLTILFLSLKLSTHFSNYISLYVPYHSIKLSIFFFDYCYITLNKLTIIYDYLDL